MLLTNTTTPLLNPTLYELLKRHFGEVVVANEGQPMACRYGPDPRTGRPSLQILDWGEAYRVNCPYCNDTRRRLYLNHRYGAYDREADSDNVTLATCFNEDCLKQEPGRYRDLRERVFRFLNLDRRRAIRLAARATARVAPAEPLRPAEAPGTLVELDELPGDHPALAYLRGRGFDPAELSSRWRVNYCTEAGPDHRAARDRLILPVIVDEVWVGWQARWVGRGEDPPGLPKYVSMRGLPRGRVLYGHDVALGQPLVVVCEGPADVWRVGPAGVALLGKQASRRQLDLLAGRFGGRPVVVLLDGDAAADGERLASRLRPLATGPVVQVRLPGDRDPGDLARETLWDLIHEQAARQGVCLPGARTEQTEGPVKEPAART